MGITSVADAIRTIFTDDIVPCCGPNTFLDADDFRRHGCYHEATDDQLRRFESSLRAIFDHLAVKRGPCKRLLTYEHWLKFMRKVPCVSPLTLTTLFALGPYSYLDTAPFPSSASPLSSTVDVLPFYTNGPQPHPHNHTCTQVDLIQIDLTERDVAFAFTWSRMWVGRPYSAAGAIKNKHLPFEGFLEALCRCAALKALPTDEEIESRGYMDAGRYLVALKAEAPAEYDALLATKATLWGGTPRQPVSRCVAHLLMVLFATIEGDARSEHTGMDIGEKPLNAYFKKFDAS